MNKFIKLIKAESCSSPGKYGTDDLRLTIELLPERLSACVELDAYRFYNPDTRKLDPVAKDIASRQLVEVMVNSFRKELERVLHEEAARKNPRPITDAF